MTQATAISNALYRFSLSEGCRVCSKAECRVQVGMCFGMLIQKEESAFSKNSDI